jgi:hypothetical protein
MTRIDPRLASALASQLESQRMALHAGAERVGWKLGIGSRERIGDDFVVGHLTSATRLRSGATYRAGDAVTLCADADAEVALELAELSIRMRTLPRHVRRLPVSAPPSNS